VSCNDFYEDTVRLKKLNEALVDRDFFVERGYPDTFLNNVPLELLKLSFPVFSPINYLDKSFAKILDIGCGAGLDMLLIKRMLPNRQVFGIDISMSLLRENVNISSNAGNVVQADAALLPFKPDSIDLVVINGVFNVIPDKRNFLKSVNVILKKHAFLFVADIFKKKDLELPEEGGILNLKHALSLKQLFKLFRELGFFYKAGKFEADYTREFGLFGLLWRKL